MSIGLTVAELRRARRESLQQVADAVGISKAHIWDLEKGRTANPSITLVRALADHFDTTVARLIGEDASEEADPEFERMFRRASKLDERDREVIADLVKLLQEKKAEREQ